MQYLQLGYQAAFLHPKGSHIVGCIVAKPWQDDDRILLGSGKDGLCAAAQDVVQPKDTDARVYCG